MKSLTSILLITSVLSTVLGAPTQITFKSSLDLVIPTSSHSISSLSTDDLNQLEAHLTNLPEKRIVELDSGNRITITEGEKALLVFHRTHFVDVTDEDSSLISSSLSKKEFPTKIAYSLKKLQPLYNTIDLVEMKRLVLFRLLSLKQKDAKLLK